MIYSEYTLLVFLLALFSVSGFQYATPLQPSVKGSRTALSSRKGMQMAGERILVIGGTRFSGLYLTKELFDRGYDVTLYNRGKTPIKAIPGESEEDLQKRIAATKIIQGDRTNAEELTSKLSGEDFYAIYDMNGRELDDTKALADLYKDKVEHFVYMSSAGVYLKSEIMPHMEGDAVDPTCRHKGKLHTEEYLAEIGLPYTSIRPTYIYGAGNYNPLEQYFFERIDQGRTLIVPGPGQHLTGLGHVKDLAAAMANVLGKEVAKGQIYNIQDVNAISFDGLVKACAVAAGKDPEDVEIHHYDPDMFDFGKKKAFPMRPQHFYTSVAKAMKDLEWEPKYNAAAGLKDAYENDFVHKKEAGTLINDFESDDLVLEDDRIGNWNYPWSKDLS
uniref:NAD-dependent epimerase/dehydratase domain-containing protein n=1 Tax=Fibrocapsa japonica TaxID=94617 RepID=A0A7S2XXV9_9STRA